jgi:hypothetical protein
MCADCCWCSKQLVTIEPFAQWGSLVLSHVQVNNRAREMEIAATAPTRPAFLKYEDGVYVLDLFSISCNTPFSDFCWI